LRCRKEPPTFRIHHLIVVMRALLLPLLALSLAAAPAAAQGDPARFFPLDAGNRWVWIGGSAAGPTSTTDWK
jgi:hypothetical protein